MKGTIIGLGIFFSILLLSVFSLYITKDFCSEIDACISESATFAEAEDWQKSGAQIKLAKEITERKAPFLKTFLPHERLFDISHTLTNLETAVNFKDLQAFETESNKLFSLIASLYHYDVPTLENIF